ncbi:MAG: helix-turn-helix domain-containing protein [Candidatus Riflebacteria bacterium]|nr:helix-turn-helix domain-containing protein [Candidatus Riflebacteria bacterium]
MAERISARPRLHCRLREARARAGLSQETLARAVGLTRQSLGAIEAGRYAPNTEVAFRLARALECRVDDLFCLEETRDEGAPVRVWGSSTAPVSRLTVARVRGRLIAHPLHGIHACQDGFASADALVAQRSHPPKTRFLIGSDQLERSAFLLGCDPALSIVSAHVALQDPTVRLRWLPTSSGTALEAVADGAAHVAGSHLGDPDRGEPSLAHARRVLSSTGGVVVVFSRWEQGLMVAAGNPKGIRDPSDLIRPDVLLINRDVGSGTRIALDAMLACHGIPAQAVRGYDREVHTHFAVARVIAAGGADVGVGSRAIAIACGLDFTPLSEVRFDLVIPADHENHPAVAVLLEVLQGRSLRDELSRFEGYDVRQMGTVLARVSPAA